MADYQTAIDLSPTESNYLDRAEIYVKLENYKKASKEFLFMIKEFPKYTNTYYSRAHMYNKQGLYEDEKKDLLNAIEIDNLDPQGYYYLAKYYQRDEKYFKVINYLQKTILKFSNDGYYISKIDSSDPVELEDVHIELGNVYKSLEEIELMCEEYKEACELGECEMYNKDCK